MIVVQRDRPDHLLAQFSFLIDAIEILFIFLPIRGSLRGTRPIIQIPYHFSLMMIQFLIHVLPDNLSLFLSLEDLNPLFNLIILLLLIHLPAIFDQIPDHLELLNDLLGYF